MVIVDVDLSHLKQFGPAMPQIQQRGLQLVGLDLLRPLQTYSPVDHGLLRQWAIVSQSQSEVKIQSPAFYAKYQNDGTGPIHAKRGGVLHWVQDGKHVFAKSTRGITGKHFVEKSINEVKPRIEQNFEVAINEVLG